MLRLALGQLRGAVRPHRVAVGGVAVGCGGAIVAGLGGRRRSGQANAEQASSRLPEACVALAQALVPCLVAQAEASADADGTIDSLVRRVLELRNQSHHAMESWVEQWKMGAEGHMKRDQDGEDLVLELVQTLRSRGLKFTDSQFEPNAAALYRSVPAEGAGDGDRSIRKDLAPFLSTVRGIEWKRADEIGDSPGKDMASVVFSRDISPDDIAQGNLGNCYFLAALASCAAAKEDHLLRDLIIEEGQDVGLYGVKFFVNGRWVTVIVDDYFPCTQDYNGAWQPIFAHSKDHDGSPPGQVELWVMIFEKAWAKLHGSYEATSGGWTEDALNYLTAGKTHSFDFDENFSEAWEGLVALVRRGQANEEFMAFLSSSTRPELASEMKALEAKGLCTGHAYSVLDAVELPTGDRVIQLRNPWGTFEWTGDWSDSDPRWTEELRAATARIDGGGAEDDGSFFMSATDFVKYFGKVGVCDPYALATGDDDGDGTADTSAISGIRLANGAVATVRCGAATEVVLTAYQQDVRSQADGTAWKKARVDVKCAATAHQWLPVVRFQMRSYGRSIPLQVDETEFSAKVVLEGEGVEMESVWLTATAADGGISLSGPPPPRPAIPDDAPIASATDGREASSPPPPPPPAEADEPTDTVEAAPTPAPSAPPPPPPPPPAATEPTPWWHLSWWRPTPPSTQMLAPEEATAAGAVHSVPRAAAPVRSVSRKEIRQAPSEEQEAFGSLHDLMRVAVTATLAAAMVCDCIR